MLLFILYAYCDYLINTYLIVLFTGSLFWHLLGMLNNYSALIYTQFWDMLAYWSNLSWRTGSYCLMLRSTWHWNNEASAICQKLLTDTSDVCCAMTAILKWHGDVCFFFLFTCVRYHHCGKHGKIMKCLFFSSRLSFYSGHSSFSMYCMLFLAVSMFFPCI